MEEPLPPTVALAAELIRRPSVTPADGGCQALLGERLEAAGFRCEPMPCGGVDNLWAVHGTDGPLLVFAGHTDVVPPGPLDAWSTPPFEPVLRDGLLHGRGAADMKGSLAAMVTACDRFLAAERAPRARIGFLLTSDEEGPAVDGTRHVVERLRERGEHIDWCVVGEPSSTTRLGDVIRVGRRGSLGAVLRVRGKQGHVAYPERALNPVHAAAPALTELVGVAWDQGNAHFPPTTLQITNVRAGTGASNVIPGELEVLFNLRFGTASSAASLSARIETLLARHGLDFRIDWQPGAEPFITTGGALLEAAQATIRECTGAEAQLSTGGGTSDGRFIAPLGTELIELGPCNATIHQVDECVNAADLELLSRIYESLLQRLAGR
jgi:succinyl-diaminopimelate desuccinylase